MWSFLIIEVCIAIAAFITEHRTDGELPFLVFFIVATICLLILKFIFYMKRYEAEEEEKKREQEEIKEKEKKEKWINAQIEKYEDDVFAWREDRDLVAQYAIDNKIEFLVYTNTQRDIKNDWAKFKSNPASELLRKRRPDIYARTDEIFRYTALEIAKRYERSAPGQLRRSSPQPLTDEERKARTINYRHGMVNAVDVQAEDTLALTNAHFEAIAKIRRNQAAKKKEVLADESLSDTEKAMQCNLIDHLTEVNMRQFQITVLGDTLQSIDDYTSNGSSQDDIILGASGE
jgi:hypothetical protein